MATYRHQIPNKSIPPYVNLGPVAQSPAKLWA
jgi:hypothetical protein